MRDRPPRPAPRARAAASRRRGSSSRACRAAGDIDGFPFHRSRAAGRRRAGAGRAGRAPRRRPAGRVRAPAVARRRAVDGVARAQRLRDFLRAAPGGRQPAQARRTARCPCTTSGCALRACSRAQRPARSAAHVGSRRAARAIAGTIGLRIGRQPRPGAVLRPRRVQRLPARARQPLRRARLPAAAARRAAHGMRTLWVTCNPDNHASRRTCERLGCRAGRRRPGPARRTPFTSAASARNAATGSTSDANPNFTAETQRTQRQEQNSSASSASSASLRLCGESSSFR